eukprot:TRINITY_DN103043_c0_g1_i1.p1 TRINITY_DN103043_c0_g1~~TRINITY_DN103043_c0_g1_i1.p1  ORF type:complete len:723 (-),score=152.40 TRINITY_DN103043_c0_g1_i1:24-2192(-)
MAPQSWTLPPSHLRIRGSYAGYQRSWLLALGTIAALPRCYASCDAAMVTAEAADDDALEGIVALLQLHAAPSRATADAGGLANAAAAAAGGAAAPTSMVHVQTEVTVNGSLPEVNSPRLSTPMVLAALDAPSGLTLHKFTAQQAPNATANRPWARGEKDPRFFLDCFVACLVVAFALIGGQDMFRLRAMVVEQRTQSEKAIAVPSNDASSAVEPVKAAEKTPEAPPPHWPVVALVGLTAYRFYTGFLSATWLPYLLAMEGEDLWRENQSLFMGVAKLIYGTTILVNPILGRLGDRAVAYSHGLGRRLFMRVGITTAAGGIFICLAAGRQHCFWPFLIGIMLWRLGEAINDVTTEAIIPELVPVTQWRLAGSIKAASFLLGGLFGYALLIVLVDLHYSWLYYAYVVGMVACAVPALILLSKNDEPGTMRGNAGETWIESVKQAYWGPTQYEGGFPKFCFGTFIFSLGTSPMFFLLLMERDLIGVRQPVALQRDFSKTSIIFFLAAAVTSIHSGLGAPEKKYSASGVADRAGDAAARELKVRRWHLLRVCVVTFGAIVLALPAIVFCGPTPERRKVFFGVAVVFGGCFGYGYSLLQECTWYVLPAAGADEQQQRTGQANAMGFNTMCRLLGIGVGNFLAGLVLDCYYTGAGFPKYRPGGANGAIPGYAETFYNWMSEHEHTQVYRTQGYIVMCVGCAVCNLLAAVVMKTIREESVFGPTCRKPG